MNADIKNLFQKPLWQLTDEEFVALNRYCLNEIAGTNGFGSIPQPADLESKRYVYGLDGLARLIGASKPTAFRLKQSGKIDAAITQIGRKLIIDADLALELAGKKIQPKRRG